MEACAGMSTLESGIAEGFPFELLIGELKVPQAVRRGVWETTGVGVGVG